jgi:hypothetical protein
LAEQIIQQVKNLCAKVVEKLTEDVAAKLVTTIVESVGERVLLSAVEGLVVRTAVSVCVEVASKAAIALADLLASCATVVGILLVILQLVDILVGYFDPFGYKNLFPPEMPRIVNENMEAALRKQFTAVSATLNFETLCARILSNEDLIEVQLQSLTDRIIYLDALVVNSEGSRIDKGQEITLGVADASELRKENTIALTERVKFDKSTYELYNDRFILRVKANKQLNYFAAISLFVSGGFYLIKLPLLCVIFLLLAVVILAVARITLDDDIIIDLLDKYRNKREPYQVGGYATV